MPLQFDNNTQIDRIVEVVFDWATDSNGRRIQVFAGRYGLERRLGINWLQQDNVKAAFDAEKATPEAFNRIRFALLNRESQVRII